MRRLKFVAIAAVSIALVFSSVPAALAGGRGGMQGGSHRAVAPYRVSRPSVGSPTVVMGVSFDATGFLVPAIAADDTSTTVSILVFDASGRHRPTLLDSVPAALAASLDTGTAYAATMVIPSVGNYLLVAAVSRDGAIIARSKPREIRVVLPYRVTKPRVAAHKVATGVSFDATGEVIPAIAGDDASTTVSVQVMSVGRRHRLTQVAAFDAVLTGPVGDGTGYAAAVTLPTAGKYVLVAVVLRDGVVLGRSGQRPLKAFDAPPVDPAPVDPAPVVASSRMLRH